MHPRAHLGPMPCFYPDGDPAEWCSRHARDHAMVRALREEGVEA